MTDPGAANSSSSFRRWCAFNFVGLLGVAVQLVTLAVLRGWLGMQYLLATALAVEAAVLHNFMWHERWTWADRTSAESGGVLRRLAGFNLAACSVSIAGNLVLMALLAGYFGLHYIVANLIAIAVCSLANYLLNDRIVFRQKGTIGPYPAGVAALSPRRRRVRRFLLAPFCWTLLVAPMPGHAAELRSESVAAWDRYVRLTEKRIGNEVLARHGFLAMDFVPAYGPGQARRAARAGDIIVTEMETCGKSGDSIEIPGGMVHHWLGLTFLPGVSLEAVMAAVGGGGAKSHRQEDVLESRILAQEGDTVRVYLKLVRSRIVTVAYNTEHVVRYQRHGLRRASSRSEAVRIAELENFNTPSEREKPIGRDRGFLWRLNSYWRYEEVEGGVLVECESISLSRDIPMPVAFVVRPVIGRVARESMTRTLAALRARLLRSDPAFATR